VNERSENNKKNEGKIHNFSLLFLFFVFTLPFFGEAENYMKNSSRPHSETMREFAKRFSADTKGFSARQSVFNLRLGLRNGTVQVQLNSMLKLTSIVPHDCGGIRRQRHVRQI
jgi:hypothetical protein